MKFIELPLTYISPSGALRGHLTLPNNCEERVGVILAPGPTRDHIEKRRVFVRFSRMLAERGLAALRFDYYGRGDSFGEAEELTLQSMVSDVTATANYLTALGYSKLIFVGRGLGAYASILASAEFDEVQAVVCWALISDPVATHRKLQGEDYLSKSRRDGFIEIKDTRFGVKYFETVADIPNLDQGFRSSCKYLFIHPPKDETTPPEAIRNIVASLNAKGVSARLIIPEEDPDLDHFTKSGIPDVLVDISLQFIETEVLA